MFLKDSDRNAFFHKLQNDLEQCGKILVVVRGPPGIGKTTLADEILYFFEDRTTHHAETDKQFVNSAGHYVFNISLVPQYHSVTFQAAVQSMNIGTEVVVVSNTGSKPYEFENYIREGSSSGYRVVIFDMLKYVTETFQPAEDDLFDHLCSNNTHGVPHDVISAMIKRYCHLPFITELVQYNTSSGQLEYVDYMKQDW